VGGNKWTKGIFARTVKVRYFDMKEESPKFTEEEVDVMLKNGSIKIIVETSLETPETDLFIASYTYRGEDWYVAEHIDVSLSSKHRIFKEIIKQGFIEGYEGDFTWMKSKCMHPSCGDSDCGN